MDDPRRTSREAIMTKRVLIIDDEPNIVISLEFLLKRAGLEVRVARDGEAGLSKLRELRPDLVVLDVMMSKLDGFEVLKALRADPAIADTRVLMLTAKTREAEQQRGLALGADAYMAKPFSTHELVDQVMALLGVES
jgi:DNA-binding response OmpR family regulator